MLRVNEEGKDGLVNARDEMERAGKVKGFGSNRCGRRKRPCVQRPFVKHVLV